MADQDKTRAVTPGRLFAAKAVLAFGALVIGTAEFAAMGLLPSVASAMDVSIPDAGHTISVYALGVVIGSPTIAIVGARMDRRLLLTLLALLILVGNAASSIAGNFPSLLLARFVTGLPHGAYYGIAAVVVAGMVPHDRRTAAIGHVMLGFAAATLIGVPLVTWMGQALGWRWSFGSMAVGAAILAASMPFAVPRTMPDADTSPLSELSAFRNLQVWLTLATATVGFGGMFAVYSYITPTLTNATGLANDQVPLFLAIFGVGMVVGNIVGGKLADRQLGATIVGMLLWNAVFIGGFSFAANSVPTAAACLFLIGMGYGLVPALQTRLMDVAPKAKSLAAASNHSAFNLANAIGALAGGAAIAAGWGWTSPGAVGGMLALAGTVIFVVALRLDSSSPDSLNAAKA